MSTRSILLPIWVPLAHLRFCAARNVSSDVRNYTAHRMLSMSVRSIMHFLYPPLLALHDLAEDAGLPDPTTGRIVLPDIMRDSHLYMEAHGVYLIGTSRCTKTSFLTPLPRQWRNNDHVDRRKRVAAASARPVWRGRPPRARRANGGHVHLPATYEVLTGFQSELPRLQTKLSTQVNNILEHRCTQRGGRLSKFFIARQNLDAAELEFSDMLVEDQNAGAMAYTDCMPQLYLIQQRTN